MDASAAETPVTPLVLMVDDDQDTLELYGWILGDRGLRTVFAGNPQQGLERAAALLPDIIVTDIAMPGPLDAFTMTRRLHADERTRHIPVVALTGYDAATVHSGGRFRHVLTKPVTPDDLVNLIEGLLAHADAARRRAVGRHHRVESGSTAASGAPAFFHPRSFRRTP